VLYKIRHATQLVYNEPVRESVMELRMQPRSDYPQRCLEFNLTLKPETSTHSYVDYLGNTVHHFDIPSMHEKLEINVTALVEVSSTTEKRADAKSTAWADFDSLREKMEYWDWLQPSHFIQFTPALRALSEELGVQRKGDPLKVLQELNSGLHRTLRYERNSTRVDSTVDDCLTQRRGVCQDFAHVFIALGRLLGVPCRYVSGYLFHRPGEDGRIAEDATHSWAEAFVPGTGWVGFDSSNDAIAGDRHIRVAVGRDYRDVPPNRGVFKGMAETELQVHVDVTQAQA
jgi:transglutaminase-like putative cysteine protease